MRLIIHNRLWNSGEVYLQHFNKQVKNVKMNQRVKYDVNILFFKVCFAFIVSLILRNELIIS